MNLYIPSSKVSSICGRDTWITVDNATIQILEQYNKPVFDKLCQAYELDVECYKYNYEQIIELFPDLCIHDTTITYRQKFMQMCNDDRVKTLVQSCQIISHTPNIIRISKRKVLDSQYNFYKLNNEQLVNSITTSDRIDTLHDLHIDPCIKERIIMDRGIKKESETFNILEKLLGSEHIIYDNKHIYIRMCSINGINYKIGGRIDAYICENGTKTGVIEIKTRKNKIYSKDNMPIKDVDQLAMYCMLTQLNIFAICQYHEGQVNLIYYTKDELIDIWNKLVVNIDSWVNDIHNLSIDPYNQRYFNILEQFTVIQ